MIIDVGDPATWPGDVASKVSALARSKRGVKYSTDLRLHVEEQPFRELLGARRIRAFHCTRLERIS
jgi:hypothetical protein